MTTYNTNLSAEFYVLSMLYRLGANASLTLGNKKAVDIIVIDDTNTMLTIDVKGLVGPYDWPADNIRELQDGHHFYVLVSFENRISDPQAPVSAWIIPANELKQFIKQYKTRSVVSRSYIKNMGEKYSHAWGLITGGVN